MIVKPSRKRIILAALLAAVSLVGWLAVDRILLVASLQNALNRDFEINYNDGKLLLSDETDSNLREFLYKVFPEPEHRFFGQKKNRADALHDRLLSLLRGRITRLEIYYPEVLRADLGAALSRFSSLKELEIYEPDFSKEDWIYIFRGLNKLPRFEKLVIYESHLRQVDDSALAILANHPGLRNITLRGARVSTEVIETFATMPNLQEIDFGNEVIDDGHAPSEPVLPEIQKMFYEGLPRVKIVFGAPTEKPPTSE